MKNFENSRVRKIMANPEIIDYCEKILKFKDDISKIKFLKFGKDMSVLITIPLALLIYKFKKGTNDVSNGALLMKNLFVSIYIGGFFHLYFKLSLAQFCEKMIFNKVIINPILLKFFYRIENMKKYKLSQELIYLYFDKFH